MNLSEVVFLISVFFGSVLVIFDFNSDSTASYNCNMGSTYFYDLNPIIPDYYFEMVGIIFILFGIGVLLYGYLHQNNGCCPWCGQPLIEEDITHD